MVKTQIFIEAFFVDESTRQIGAFEVASPAPVEILEPSRKPQMAEAVGKSIRETVMHAEKKLGEKIIDKMDE